VYCDSRKRAIPLIAFLLMILAPYSFALGSSQCPMSFTSYNLSGLSELTDVSRGPLLYDVTNHSAGVFWRTTVPTNATVKYGLNTSLLETVSNSTPGTIHRIKLQGLQSGTKYYYNVVSNGVPDTTYHFRTAPPDGQAFKMIIMGDNRPDTETVVQPQTFSNITQMVIAEEPNLVILTGDYVYSVTADNSSNTAKWSAFKVIIDQVAHYAPVYAAIGNHDTGLNTGALMLQYFFDAFEQDNESSTYFSFDYAGVHLMILDSDASSTPDRITGAQYAWLVDELTATKFRMKFVFAHAPLYPIVHIGSSLDTNITERDALQQLFELNNVTVFAAGHDHAYNRMTVNGVVHLISGGAGAPLYPNPWGGAFNHYVTLDVSSNLVNMSAIGLDGKVKDNYKLPYTGPIEIFLRVVANTSTKVAGSMPSIYFSQVPAQKSYSWDGVSNTTVLTGFPSAPGQHILDVYARNGTGAWSHARFAFTTAGTTSTTTTTTTSLAPGVLEAIVLVGAAGVIVVIVLWFLLRSRRTG
jgi:predicted phosphodiesterase